MKIPLISKLWDRLRLEAPRDFWANSDPLPEDDSQAEAQLTAVARKYHADLRVTVRRSFRGHRDLLISGGDSPEAHDQMIALVRVTPKAWAFRVALDLTPAQDWNLSYRMNRESLEAVEYQAPNWRGRPMFGRLCLLYLEYAVLCFHVQRNDLVSAWLELAGRMLGEAWRYWDEIERERCDRPEVAYLWLADALHGVLSRGEYKPSRQMPFERAIEASGGSGADYDCMRLYFSLLSVAANDPAAYKAAQGLKWRKDPECARERALARQLKQCFEEAPSSDLWVAYAEVFDRWRARTVQTDSEATLYQQVLRDALAFTWTVKRGAHTDLATYYTVLRDGVKAETLPN